MIQTGIVLFLLIVSSFFFLVGTVGLIRMPDVFCRMHATTKSDTLGAGLALLALIVYRGFDVISIKLLLVLIFIWITNPTAAHIIAKAAYHNDQVEKR
ncbi:monovalent cation/proton antiporter, MnhG/PhaG subunit [Alkaliphilus metalliredigens QYMF]|uniref:Monovalent cation/proton antiporter, MnhG/PhaG subunit n=1 Tax=Alkaliphilus metalliredigens (strain QYMF) TaxID=293826 RepID=A6TVM0_ALKMQ|nr:monovalent cation/H(+) antiporter subunit G [Alkaliphilus metalliredigens]ABR50238.1 monovalent cation/proton antiporter, MnhG/PhaG subunit [Alkaliphilus metalliredigens QYMF]